MKPNNNNNNTANRNTTAININIINDYSTHGKEDDEGDGGKPMPYGSRDPPLLITRDHTKQFQQMKQNYLAKSKNELDMISLKFKQVKLNINDVLNDSKVLSKIVHNCLICGSEFGRIFNKKQNCVVCGSIVCSNCNQNTLPINALDPPPSPKPNNQQQQHHHNSNAQQPQQINTCNLCYHTLSTVIRKNELTRLKFLSSKSDFVQIYEQMQLNMMDLQKNLPKFKATVEKITDNSSPLISNAKDLESTISILIKELENGIKYLKNLQAPTPKQNQVIFNIKHCFATFLQTSLPIFRIYTSQLSQKLTIKPPSSPVNTSSSSTTTSTTVPTTSSSTNTSKPPSKASTPLSSSPTNATSGIPIFSSLISSFSSLLDKKDQQQQHQQQQHQSQQPTQEDLDDLYSKQPDSSKIISVGPAVCAMSGSLITITGERLSKPSIKISVGGVDVKPLKVNQNAIMFLGPPQANEGEVELIIKDFAHILAKQNIYFTNSCFQNERDLININDYALDIYEKSTSSPALTSPSMPQKNTPFHSTNTSGSSNNNNNNNYSGSGNSPSISSPRSIKSNDTKGSNTTPEGTSPSNLFMKKEIGSTGGSIGDIIIEMIHPTISPLCGIKVSVQLKYPVTPDIQVSVASLPIHNIELGNDNKKISFLSPPLKEGTYSLEFVYRQKYLELPNVIFYDSSLPYTNASAASSNTLRPPPEGSFFPKEQPPIARSSRVWGKKS
ncbi:hypothetical protein CYY_000804 [Polysphondylium violaceum]|uniref:FYVE-type domain-containing protein n=1 Tax=Polysphondylium violaceum TaxID=133409 RepID=A0A8J4UWV6_9MYCE|nr:hypothetical protein CYY_000804 [Polysphondylium violaceum]